LYKISFCKFSNRPISVEMDWFGRDDEASSRRGLLGNTEALSSTGEPSIFIVSICPPRQTIYGHVHCFSVAFK